MKVYRSQKLGCQLLLGLSVAVGTGLPSGLLCLVVLLKLLVLLLDVFQLKKGKTIKEKKEDRKEGSKA